MSLKSLLLGVCLAAAAVTSFAGITNITPIAGLDAPSRGEYVSGISRDQLTLSYLSVDSSFVDINALLTTRTTTLAAFNPPSGSALDIIVDAFSSAPTPRHISDDGLRLWYSVYTDGTTLSDIYHTTRASVTQPFPVGSALSVLNSTDQDAGARLTSDELRIVFASDSSGDFRIYEATRPDTSSAFSAPSLLTEFSTFYTFLDISADGLTIFLGDTSGLSYYFATRANLASPFGSPTTLYTPGGVQFLSSGSVSGDMTKIYFSMGTLFGVTTTVMYSGDLDLSPPAPTPTPTPSPTPSPSPTPFDTSSLVPIYMPVEPDAIPGVGQDDVRLAGGSFDSQGRYCFFNQRRNLGGGNFAGESQLLRATPNGVSAASVEVIATQAQLVAADSDWTHSSAYNIGLSLDTLSDDSIILLSINPTAVDIWRIVPGVTPAITLVGSSSPLISYAQLPVIAVDRGQSPNVIYVGIENDIYSIPATGGTLDLWKENAVNYSVMDLAVDINGDVIAVDTYLGFSRVDKDTQAITPIWIYDKLDWYAGQALAINPETGDLFCFYLIENAISYPFSTRVFNVLKMERTGAESFADPTLFLYGTHILEDPDVLPWAEPNDEIIAPLGSFSFNPEGQVLWFCNGFFNNVMYYGTQSGTEGVIGFWSAQPSSANPALWMNLE